MTTEAKDPLTELEEMIRIPLDERDEDDEDQIFAKTQDLISRFRMLNATVTHEPQLVTILREIAAERGQQDQKWGEQNHPSGTSEDLKVTADMAREACQEAFAKGEGSWLLIMLEEIGEAMAETDPARLRAELIQALAVGVAWVECLDRQAQAVSA